MIQRTLGAGGPTVGSLGLGYMAMSALYGPADRGEASQRALRPRPVLVRDRAAAVPDRQRTARDRERDHLGTPGQDPARPGQHLRRHDDPGHRAPAAWVLLFAGWHFNDALLWSGLITMAAIAYLLATMRAHRLTPARLALAGGMYGALAVGLIPLLT